MGKGERGMKCYLCKREIDDSDEKTYLISGLFPPEQEELGYSKMNGEYCHTSCLNEMIVEHGETKTRKNIYNMFVKEKNNG